MDTVRRKVARDETTKQSKKGSMAGYVGFKQKVLEESQKQLVRKHQTHFNKSGGKSFEYLQWHSIKRRIGKVRDALKTKKLKGVKLSVEMLLESRELPNLERRRDEMRILLEERGEITSLSSLDENQTSSSSQSIHHPFPTVREHSKLDTTPFEDSSFSTKGTTPFPSSYSLLTRFGDVGFGHPETVKGISRLSKHRFEDLPSRSRSSLFNSSSASSSTITTSHHRSLKRPSTTSTNLSNLTLDSTHSQEKLEEYVSNYHMKPQSSFTMTSSRSINTKPKIDGRLTSTTMRKQASLKRGSTPSSFKKNTSSSSMRVDNSALMLESDQDEMVETNTCWENVEMTNNGLSYFKRSFFVLFLKKSCHVCCLWILF